MALSWHLLSTRAVSSWTQLVTTADGMQAAGRCLAGVALSHADPRPRVAYCMGQDSDGPPRKEPARGHGGKPDERWSLDMRIDMAIEWCSALGWEKRKEIRSTGVLPSCADVPGLKNVYARIHERLTADLREVNPHAEAPTTQATRLASQRWGMNLLQRKSVLDEPPHKPGYKMDPGRKALLEAMKDAILAGFPSANGHFYYANVKEAVVRDPKVASLMRDSNYKRPESVWKVLKEEWPGLHLGKLIMKKLRNHEETRVRLCSSREHSFSVVQSCSSSFADTYSIRHLWTAHVAVAARDATRVLRLQHAVVQSCCRQIDADECVKWPSYYHKYTRKKNPSVHDHIWDLCTTVGLSQPKAPLFDWAVPYFWNKAHCYTQVYIDAWTNDGSQLIHKGTRVIKMRGADTVPYENKMSHSSIGQMPKFSVYTTASTWGGVTPFFTKNSCTGRAGSFAGYKSWVDGLSERSKQHIRAFMYYNHEEAKGKLPATWATDPFDASLFRVCSARLLHSKTLFHMRVPARFLCMQKFELPLVCIHSPILSQTQVDQMHRMFLQKLSFLLVTPWSFTQTRVHGH